MYLYISLLRNHKFIPLFERLCWPLPAVMLLLSGYDHAVLLSVMGMFQADKKKQLVSHNLALFFIRLFNWAISSKENFHKLA